MEGVPIPEIPEIDPHFEPQVRARSNTWPVRPKEFDADSEGARTPNSVNSENDKESEQKVDTKVDPLSLSQKKASGSRRNAWGNLSYADLITKAVQSSPEGRLTLSQIYDWMVQNVPYFRDKGDSNSSAGWKNSIRHNLSLHSRFMRVQNEGTGKSSWWVLNPEAKPGKSPRRRATSMDTKEYVKKRGRVKRKVDQLRAAMEGAAMENGGNFGSAHELSNLQDPFALSPQDYRQRASSNASSIGGRLSPISSQYDDFDDRQIPGGLSPVSWNQNPAQIHDPGFCDLSEGMAGLMGDFSDPSLQDSMVTSSGVLQNTSPLNQQLSPNGYPDQNASYLQVGGYPDNMRQLSPQQLSPQPQCNPTATIPATSPNGYSPNVGLVNNMGLMRHQRRSNFGHQSLTELLEQPDGFEEAMEEGSTQQISQHTPVTSQQNTSNQVRPNIPFLNGTMNNSGVVLQNRHSPGNTLLGGLNVSNLTEQQRNMLTTSLLRRVLSSDITELTPTQQQNKQFILQQNGLSHAQTAVHMSGGSMQSQNVAPMMPRAGSELEFLTDVVPGDFTDCPDVDQLINHEMLIDGNLDFNFDGSSQQQQQQQGSSTEKNVFNGAVQT